MKKLFPILFFLISPLASALEGEVSGNIEAQSRHTWNNNQAKDDLFQNWSSAQFNLLYGNLNGKLTHKNLKIETNWFVRHSQSNLYQGTNPLTGQQTPYAAAQIFTFPNRLVARDIFKLQYDHQQADYRTESILNKFLLEWNEEDYSLTLGRIYINYGLGETFNPINPFNQPTGLTSIQQVAQGNDGGAMSFFVSDKYTVNFYLLGDKRIEGYDGQIDHTYWVHGEYQASDKLQLDYVAGQDQNRQKAGGQIAYRFEEAMVFGQALYQSHVTTKNPSTNLWDVLIGYDQQLTNKWHIRAEGGYQKFNRFASLTNFGDRFLPTEYFIALANTFEAHPLLKLSGTVVHDIKSGFTYFIARTSYSIKENLETELFGYVPMAKGDSPDLTAQKLVTTDLGVALRAFF